MDPVSVSALVLAGLESAKLLIKLFPNYDQRMRKHFEADLDAYYLQKTMPDDHPDLNDDFFLRVRHRLLEHVKQINAFAAANGQNG